MKAFTFLIESYRRLSNMGVRVPISGNSSNLKPMDPDIRKLKKIILSNQISISVALLNLSYALIFLFLGKSKLGWLEILLFLSYLSIHRLNGAGFTLFSRIFLMVLANLDILIYTLILGSGTGIHFLFLISGWGPLLLFGVENLKSLIFGIALSASFFLGCEFFAPFHGFDPLSNTTERTLFLITLLTTLGVQILFALYFLNSNRRTETALGFAGRMAKAADEAKGQFLVNTCEGIRIPIRSILESEETLKKNGMTPENLGWLKDIQSSTLDLTHIVDEILEISKFEASGLKLNIAPFSLVDFSERILRPFEFEAANRGISIVLVKGEGLPNFVIGDFRRLRQVLRNLLGNAVKFTDSGLITLRMNQPQPGVLHFEVEDTGIGIPTVSHSQIFEPFFQANSTKSRKSPGTGLGLFISRQIVELMGGRISFRPGAEQGSNFSFSVPVKLDDSLTLKAG